MLYYIQTFGCQMNERDSTLLAERLEAAGFQPATAVEEADIVVVNTCSVRESAENRALGYIGSLKHLHDIGSAAAIVVMGCMAQRPEMAEKLSRSYRHVGIIIGTFAVSRLPDYINDYLTRGRRIIDVEERYGEDPEQGGSSRGEQWRAQVNINFGCNNFCSYCIVPYVRGRERSRRPESIIAEISAMAAQGLKEVQLLGQNVNSYGKDLGGETSFAALLRQVSAIDGLQRIRYMTSHPRDFGPELIETIAALPKVCRHFHLPIQSGCDRLLKLMNRGYDSACYLNLLTQIRAVFPQAVITTDLIVGFPGETEQDFRQTLELIKAARFDAAYTFLYSKRSGTPAAELPDQVDEAVKKERLQRLMEEQNRISLELNQAMLGRSLPVLVEGESKNSPDMLCGRSDGNKIIVFPSRPSIRPGDEAIIRITTAQTWNLSGELQG